MRGPSGCQGCGFWGNQFAGSTERPSGPSLPLAEQASRPDAGPHPGPGPGFAPHADHPLRTSATCAPLPGVQGRSYTTFPSRKAARSTDPTRCPRRLISSGSVGMTSTGTGRSPTARSMATNVCRLSLIWGRTTRRGRCRCQTWHPAGPVTQTKLYGVDEAAAPGGPQSRGACRWRSRSLSLSSRLPLGWMTAVELATILPHGMPHVTTRRRPPRMRSLPTLSDTAIIAPPRADHLIHQRSHVVSWCLRP